MNLPLNTAQVCRIFNGAKSRYDIKFCRDKPCKFKLHANWYKERKRIAYHPYDNCPNCLVKWPQIYNSLMILERKGFVETRLEWRSDPIVAKKDNLRMWAIKGGLPSLDQYNKGV